MNQLPKILQTEYWDKVFSFIKQTPLEQWDNGTKYAYNVCINRTILTSKMVLYACARHLLFLYRSQHEDDFPFTYVSKWGKRIDGFCKNIIVPEINAPFINPAYRQFISYFFLGWRYKNDLTRIMTREIFDIEARKQWKSSYYAMLMLAFSLEILGDGVPKVFISGPQNETSKIPYFTAVNYITKSPNLHVHFSKYHTQLIQTTQGGQIRHLPFEKSAIEGQNPSVTILTEYHLHPDDTMRESANSARNTSRKNSLIIYDTTKGHDINSVCYSREKAYKKYLEQQIAKPEELEKNFPVFLFCAELDPEDYVNWQDPTLWIKANPNLELSVTLDDLKAEFNLIETIHEEIEFKIKRLGMWVGAANAYFDLRSIIDSDEATTPYVEHFMKNTDLVLNGLLGIDLASIIDTTAAVLQYEIPCPDGEPIWVFIGKNFIPREQAIQKEKTDRVPYRDWKRAGWMEFTDNQSTVDYEFILEYVKDLKIQHNISKVAYDPWQFNVVKMMFLNNNVFYEDDIVPVKQGVYLTPIFREFERKLRLKKICLLGNQVLIDHITNVCVKESRTGDNIMVQKINDNQRIDGFMAMLYSASLRIDNPAIKSRIVPYTLIPEVKS